MQFGGLHDTSPASLLRDRRVTLALSAAGASQLLATLAGLGGWPCPLKSLAGVPCPGCGLSRACAALARGEWGEALAAHAFAPVVAAALAVCAVAAFLPPRGREALAGLSELVERRTRLTAVLLAALLLYWSARVLFLPGAFNL